MIIVEPHQGLNTPTVATIGMFDGVHRGHLSLIEQVSDIATSKGLGKSVVTFSTHPREVIQPGYKMSLLNTFEERISHLEQTGIDNAIVLDFTPQLAQLTAQQFITMLHNTYNIQVLCIGYDHRFGHNRSEGFEEYCRYGEALGMEIIQAQELNCRECSISSSAIRKMLIAGNISAANKMLGYNYNISGIVVSGRQIGRELGFPTANIQPNNSQKLIPALGVYAVKVTLPDNSRYAGIMNIGRRPTIEGNHDVSLEVHIFNFDSDLYNKQLTIELIDYIREEKQFDSLTSLRKAIQQDTHTAYNILQDK